jgi:hypothetical protein
MWQHEGYYLYDSKILEWVKKYSQLGLIKIFRPSSDIFLSKWYSFTLLNPEISRRWFKFGGIPCVDNKNLRVMPKKVKYLIKKKEEGITHMGFS